jgi:hypothetical protein
VILLFNSNNLVFHDSFTLENVREIPYNVLIALFLLILLAYFLRSFATWRLLNRVGLGAFFLSFVPFLHFFAYKRLGKEVCGWGPKVRLLYRFLSLVYLVGILLALLAPTFKLMVIGIALITVCYFSSLYPLLSASKGICGKVQYSWLIPLVGSLIMLVTIFSSRDGLIYVKPKNYDGLFKKVDDMEITL